MIETEALRREVARLRWKVEKAMGDGKGDVLERGVDYVNGDHYQGEVLWCGDRVLRHGRGRHQCSNGDIYEGGWSYDRREGNGKLEKGSGDVIEYDGEWKADKTNGSGICVYRDGSIYEGEFSDDLRSGWGVMRFKNGEIYEGEWMDDGIEGKGVWSMKEGMVFYEGTFEKGKISRGKYVDKEQGMKFEGSFVDGVPHGEGNMTKEGEWMYHGELQDGRQWGRGECRWEDGHCYEGEWQEGLRHGKGKASFQHLLLYDGEWSKDQKHGNGMQMLPSGDRYVGQFWQDEIHGDGIMYYTNGDKYKGQWTKNKRTGYGKCIYANGNKYKGEWCDDVRHGRGTCRFSDGTEFTGLWKDDAWIQSSASPAETVLKGEGLVQSTAGEPAAFVIEARDENGGKRLSGDDAFTVVLRDARGNQFLANVEDHGNGTYTAGYQLNVSGRYELYALLGEAECVAASPYEVQVLPADPCVKQSQVDVRSLTAGQKSVDEVCEFFVSPRDAYGNECLFEDVSKKFPIEVSVEGKCGTCSVTVSLGIDGHYHGSFVPREDGYYRLFVQSNGKQLPQSPFSIQIGDIDSKTFVAIVDESVKWDKLVEAEISDGEEAVENTEEHYIREHPDIPVVSNLEDLWRLNKLQRDRKKRSMS